MKYFKKIFFVIAMIITWPFKFVNKYATPLTAVGTISMAVVTYCVLVQSSEEMKIRRQELLTSIEPVLSIEYDTSTAFKKSGSYDFIIRNSGMNDLYDIHVREIALDGFLNSFEDKCFVVLGPSGIDDIYGPARTNATFDSIPKGQFVTYTATYPNIADLVNYYKIWMKHCAGKTGSGRIGVVSLDVYYRRVPDGKLFNERKSYYVMENGGALSDLDSVNAAMNALPNDNELWEHVRKNKCVRPTISKCMQDAIAKQSNSLGQ